MLANAVPVLLSHNRYQQRGGEDQVFASEGALLESRGHRVVRHVLHNDRVNEMSRPGAAGATVWNGAAYREVRRVIRAERPMVAHFHNTFPLASPAVYYAARAEGLPVVQTLHNYRLLCPNALFFREGRVCESCLGRSVPWEGVARACYRGSRAASGAVALMLTAHRAAGTWDGAVDVYVALSEFARRKFVEGGLPAEKIVVKPNFVHPDPGPGSGRGGYVLFVGRLSPEKGVGTLLEAWERLEGRATLKIVGDGPLAPVVAAAAERLEGVEWLGRQPADRTLALMKDALALALPSVCYENFPIVLAEAYAVGLPVIASDLGSMSSLVDHGRTGLRFVPGAAEDLAGSVGWVLEHPEELRRMRGEARAEYEAKYTADQNHKLLVEIYRSAAEKAGE